MGMYIYVTKEDVKRMKTIIGDAELNELFQEALEYNNYLLIEENYYYRRKKGYRGWLLGEKVKAFEYRLSFEFPALDGSPYQAQYITACGNDRKSVITYLYGIINGGLGRLRQQTKLKEETK